MLSRKEDTFVNKLNIKTKELFEVVPEYLKPYFDAAEYPWEILPKIKEITAKLLQTGLEGYTLLEEGILFGTAQGIHVYRKAAGNNRRKHSEKDNGDTGTDQQHLTLKTKGCKMEGESGQKHPAKSQSHFHQLSILLLHP